MNIGSPEERYRRTPALAGSACRASGPVARGVRCHAARPGNRKSASISTRLMHLAVSRAGGRAAALAFASRRASWRRRRQSRNARSAGLWSRIRHRGRLAGRERPADRAMRVCRWGHREVAPRDEGRSQSKASAIGAACDREGQCRRPGRRLPRLPKLRGSSHLGSRVVTAAFRAGDSQRVKGRIEPDLPWDRNRVRENSRGGWARSSAACGFARTGICAGTRLSDVP